MHQRRRQVEATPHATGKPGERPVGGAGQPEHLQQFVGAGLQLRPRLVSELADQHQVFASGQPLVHRRVLAGQADHRPDPLRVPAHVDAEHRRRAGIGPDGGGEHPDGRRLTGAVRSKQPKHGAVGNDQVDPVEGLDVPVPLGQAAGLNSRAHATSERANHRSQASNSASMISMTFGRIRVTNRSPINGTFRASVRTIV